MIYDGRLNKLAFTVRETEEKHGYALQKQKEADKKRVGENCAVHISLVDMASNELKLY